MDYSEVIIYSPDISEGALAVSGTIGEGRPMSATEAAVDITPAVAPVVAGAQLADGPLPAGLAHARVEQGVDPAALDGVALGAAGPAIEALSSESESSITG